MINKIKKLGTLIVYLLATLTLNGQARVLEVPFITQQPHGNWCWAATCAMASTYYGNNSSLCGIVEWARVNIGFPNRGTSNCCGQPTPSACEPGLFLSDMPAVLASEGLSSSTNGVLSFASVKDVINDNRPLIIKGIHEATGGSHSLIIIGYNVSDIQYIDPYDGFHINSYSDAISTECLGAFLWKWAEYTHVLTTNACPANLSLHNTIGANANIHAQVSLTCDGIINNSSTVSLTSGNNILFNSGFEIQLGSTLEASVSSNPCQ